MLIGFDDLAVGVVVVPSKRSFMKVKLFMPSNDLLRIVTSELHGRRDGSGSYYQ